MKKNQLDISELIDPIEEKLFRRCVDILYPELNFRYLTKEDIRKADIKERLTTPSSWVSGAVLRKNAVRISLCISSRADIRIPVYDSLGLYIMIVKKYFELMQARCKPGSREFRYVELAIDRLGGEDLSISDMDDMYLIMMSAYRTLFESNARVQYEFEPMVLSFDEETALYGKLVRSTYFRQAINGFIHEENSKTDKLRKGIKLNLSYDNDDIREIEKYFGIYSTIFLFRNLQKYGLDGGGETNG